VPSVRVTFPDMKSVCGTTVEPVVLVLLEVLFDVLAELGSVLRELDPLLDVPDDVPVLFD